MVLTALRGAIGFFSRLPVGHDPAAWNAFRTTPSTIPITGYFLGTLIFLPFLLSLPDLTTAFVFLVWLYALTGITHVDGLADLGDALVSPGNRPTRRRIMKDTTTGVGAIIVVCIVLIGLTLAAITISSRSLPVLFIVITSEVSAKLTMTILVCLGTAPHEGLGQDLASTNSPRALIIPSILALPAAFLTWPHPAAAIALLVSPLAALTIKRWAQSALGGITGDVIGAGNELTRVVALHAGVLTWMLY